MQKVQKTYTPEFKREAGRLAQTSGKSMRLTDEVRLLHLSYLRRFAMMPSSFSSALTS